MLKIITAALVIVCILSAFYFVYKWYFICANFKKLTLKDIVMRGYYKPHYITTNDLDFNSAQAKVLNKWFSLMLTAIIIGFMVSVFENLIL